MVDFHKYENAPEEVAFLRNNHRHVFHIEAKIEVWDDDRELEFFIVQNHINSVLFQLSSESSCEMKAKKLLKLLIEKYGINRRYQVSVFEDNENGAEVIY